MTPFDTNDLIAQLQSGIAERQSGISAPDGIGDSARRAARRRTATRAVGAGVPVLAAASVATVLATSSGPGTAATSGLSGSAHTASAMSGGPVALEDTAYIVRRVKANVAAAGQGGTVIHESAYARGNVTSDGSLVNLGWKIGEVYEYTTAGGSEYQRQLMYEADGSPWLTMTNHFSPEGNGTADDAQTIINPRNDTYSQTQYPGISDPRVGAPTPNLYSSPSEVQQALESGKVTQTGTATVSGTQAIALSIAVPSVPNIPRARLTLYVDARTYQPLRTVTVYDGLPDLEVADWMPATADNVAVAEDDSIPAAYTKVDKAQAVR
jgi:hypothetical protein